MGLPSYAVIDPTIKHVGVSKLRELNATVLKETDDTFVIQDNNIPLAVLLTYEKFLLMQQELMSVVNTLELLNRSQRSAERTGWYTRPHSTYKIGDGLRHNV
jgi:hypothetical protein